MSGRGLVDEGSRGRGTELTQRMAATKLRLLLVFALELFTDAIEQLHVALVGVLLERIDKGP